MDTPPVVSHEEGRAAREALLAKEEKAVEARNALAAQRRRLPWVRVEKQYAFEGPNGRANLVDLFDGCRQLIVYRFFFQPGVADYPEGGCPGCSGLRRRHRASRSPPCTRHLGGAGVPGAAARDRAL